MKSDTRLYSSHILIIFVFSLAHKNFHDNNQTFFIFKNNHFQYYIYMKKENQRKENIL